MLARCIPLFIGVIVALAAPASAQASAVSVAGSTLSFAAVDGEANDVTVAFAPGSYTDHRRGGAR